MISLCKHLGLATSCAALALLMAGPVSAKDGHGNSGDGAPGNSELAHSKTGPGNASDAAAAHANPNANLGVGSSGNTGDTGGTTTSSSGVLLAAVTSQPAGTTSALVFTNTGSQAGTAIVTLFAADTGTQIATFTTTSVPALGALVVKVSDIVAGATPALTAAQAAAVLDAGVTAAFSGDVQLINAGASTVTNLSACGKDLASVGQVVGNVAGPGSTGFTDAVRIVNAGGQGGHVTLTVHDAADGSILGTWTSADVPAHGSLTVSVASLASAATPVVDATKTALVLSADQLASGLSLQHLSQVKGATSVADLSSTCVLHGGATQSTQSGGSSGDGSADDSSGDDDNSDGTGATTPATTSN